MFKFLVENTMKNNIHLKTEPMELLTFVQNLFKNLKILFIIECTDLHDNWFIIAEVIAPETR